MHSQANRQQQYVHSQANYTTQDVKIRLVHSISTRRHFDCDDNLLVLNTIINLSSFTLPSSRPTGTQESVNVLYATERSGADGAAVNITNLLNAT